MLVTKVVGVMGVMGEWDNNRITLNGGTLSQITLVGGISIL